MGFEAPLEAADEAKPWTERFSSEDDMWASYLNSEREMNRAQSAEQSAAERADQAEEYAAYLEEQMQAYAAAAQQQPQQQPQSGADSQLLHMYQQALDQGDAQTQLAINMGIISNMLDQRLQGFQQQAAQQAPPGNDEAVNQLFAMATVDLLRQQHPDWEEIRSEVGDLVADYPNLLPDTNEPAVAARALSYAANLVKPNRMQQNAARGIPPAANQQKRVAQGLQGTGQHPGVEVSDADWAQQVKAQNMQGFRIGAS